MKGIDGIPSLHLIALNKLISKLPKAPTMFFSNLFPTAKAESDTIMWEIEYGSAGMTPFVAPGSIAPAIGTDGIGEASAKAAFMKEKMYFDEEFLNNMRQVGTFATFQTAQRKLAKGLQKLNYRVDRRREWMMAKMLIDGSLTYTQKGGTKFTVSYGVPSSHLVTLGTDYKWGTGTSRSPMSDIMTGKTVLRDDAGVSLEKCVLNSVLLKVLLLDSDIQGLLKSSAFGDGNLFSNPSQVLGTLLGCGDIMVYDEFYEIPANLIANVTGGSSTVIYVDDASDFEVGGTLRFHDYSSAARSSYEDETITAVDAQAGTVTVATAPTASFTANEDVVTMKKKYIADNKFFMFSTTGADGQKAAEFMEAPYGVDRRWGKFVDRKVEWDPEGLWMRVQDKGLPVMYNPDTTYTITAT